MNVRKIVGTSLQNVPSRVRRSQKNPLVTKRCKSKVSKRCHGETEMDSLEKENERMRNNSRNEQ